MLEGAQADFVKKGHAAAYEILARGCDFPPSLEQFEHELLVARRRQQSITVDGLARRLSDSYHRVRGLFGEEE
jgi:hypothetical protein